MGGEMKLYLGSAAISSGDFFTAVPYLVWANNEAEAIQMLTKEAQQRTPGGTVSIKVNAIDIASLRKSIDEMAGR